MDLSQDTYVYLETMEETKMKMRNLKRMGILEYYVHKTANSRRGHWFNSNLIAVKWAVSKERLINGGFYDLTTAYQSVHVNY